MELLESFFFLFIIIIFLTTIKSNTFLIIFGAAIYLFFLLQLLVFDSIGILTSFLNYILTNPIGLLILPIPLMIDVLHRYLKKIIKINKKLE